MSRFMIVQHYYRMLYWFKWIFGGKVFDKNGCELTVGNYVEVWSDTGYEVLGVFIRKTFETNIIFIEMKNPDEYCGKYLVQYATNVRRMSDGDVMLRMLEL